MTAASAAVVGTGHIFIDLARQAERHWLRTQSEVFINIQYSIFVRHCRQTDDTVWREGGIVQRGAVGKGRVGSAWEVLYMGGNKSRGRVSKERAVFWN